MPRQRFNDLNYGDPMVARILDAGELCVERFGIRGQRGEDQGEGQDRAGHQ